jgi:RND family efflux transporter MFP subunit
LKLPGEVQGSRDSILSAALGGYVERVLVKVGDQVKRGDSIVWIDKALYEAQMAEAAARLASANSELAVVERAGKSVSKSRRDVARFSAQAAQAAYRVSELRYHRARLAAPFDGVIAAIDMEEGEVVAPGGAVARLVELDPVTVTVFVADRDVVSLKSGIDVQVTTEAAAGIRSGRIELVSPAADQNTRSFRVDVTVPNPGKKLLPGMIATVHVELLLEQEQIAVPQYVVVTAKGGNGIFILEDDIARWRPVRLGNVIRDQVIVDSGIEVGQEMVVTGHRELVDGDRTTVNRKGRCCNNGKVVFGAGE